MATNGTQEFIDTADQEFIDIAIEQKYISEADVLQCLQIQRQMPEKQTIGEILYLYDFLNKQQYDAIVAILARDRPSSLQELSEDELKQQRANDRRLAEIALREGIINESQLVESVEVQRNWEMQGSFVPLSLVLLELGYIKEEDKEYIKQGGAGLTAVRNKEEELIRLFNEKIRKVTAPKKKYQGPVLEVLQGTDKGNVYVLNKLEMTIGRVKGSDIRLNDICVSRIHCKLCYEEDNGWVIIDMMSSHGVYVNGKRIQKRQSLYNRDQLELGKTLLQIRS